MSSKKIINSTPTGAKTSGLLYGCRSIIIAFVMALLFRGFVVEGFVIPTGSMAPTLLGEHYRLYGKQTGSEIAIGRDRRRNTVNISKVADPLLGNNTRIQRISTTNPKIRTGDRILVSKTLYAFQEPQRFDVTVFTNPTNSQGSTRNYVKRLIGLPNESVWILDGDVFTSKNHIDFEIQRKPQSIQNFLWEPLFNSNQTCNASSQNKSTNSAYWQPEISQHWNINNNGQSFTNKYNQKSTIKWNKEKYPFSDWLSYNQATPEYRSFKKFPVSDLLFEFSFKPLQENISIEKTLESRSHIYTFHIIKSKAIITLKNKITNKVETVSKTIQPIKKHNAIHVRFAHADQRLWIEINKDTIVEFLYNWNPIERLKYTTGYIDKPITFLENQMPISPSISLSVIGGHAEISNLKIYRDLYWRPCKQQQLNDSKSTFKGSIGDGADGYGTSSNNIAKLNKNQFYFLGDNSAMSKDSRLWGWPDIYVSQQIDPTPFVVHRSLLIGKAWAVYFPSLIENDYYSFFPVPDFGRIRFIR